jgi:glycosyltransferase involved in cell wall biosynthesis
VGHYATMITKLLAVDFDMHLERPSRWPWAFHARAYLNVVRQPRARYFSPESLIVPTLVGRRAAVVVHDITPITHPGVHTRRNLIVHRLLLRLACRRVGLILVPTIAVRSALQRHLGVDASKVRVTSEGQRLRFASRVPLADREPMALYVGTIEPRKNVNLLLQAFLAAAAPGWTLVIAGKIGWLNEQDELEFRRLTADPRVTYLSYVSDDALVDLYARASLFAYPSSAEGFGLPPLEAMAAGTPVVTTDDPAIMEVVGDAGYIVPLADLTQGLKTALTRMTTSLAMRQRHSEAGVRRATEFTWEQAAENTRVALMELRPRW